MEKVIVYNQRTKENEAIKADGIFIEIGVVPNNKLLLNKVKMNEYGEVIVDENQMTSIPGLFSAGDVTTDKHKQIIIAAADGAKAALAVHNYLRMEN
jgi:alkyl hydroperoxide reductase subunit F